MIGVPRVLSRELCVMPTYVALRPVMAYTVTRFERFGLMASAVCIVFQKQSWVWARLSGSVSLGVDVENAMCFIAAWMDGGKSESLWLALDLLALLPRIWWHKLRVVRDKARRCEVRSRKLSAESARVGRLWSCLRLKARIW